MAMNYTIIASSEVSGPLVTGPNLAQSARLVEEYFFNQQQFYADLESYVNTDMVNAEDNQSEGQRIELEIVGLTIPLEGSQAVNFADFLNNQFVSGQMVNTDGTQLTPWPEYPNQIAWGDNNADTLTLRWVKEGPEVLIIVGVILAVLGFALYELLSRSNWSMNAVTPQSTQSSSGGNPSVNPLSIWSFLIRNWWWETPVLLGLALTPWIIKQTRKTYEESQKFERDVEGGRR